MKLRFVRGHVLAIASHTFREAYRAQLLPILIVSGILTMGLAKVMSTVALGDTARIMKDVGLATIDFIGLLIIGFLGTTLLHREIDKRSIVVLLSKPVGRGEFVVGKFLALSMTLVVAVAVETVFLEIALLLETGALDLRVMWGSAMALLMLLTVNAVATLYSSFAGPMVAAFLTLATYVAGRLSGDLARFADLQGVSGLDLVGYILPNLASMDIRTEIVHGMPLDPLGLLLAVGHGLSYSLAALVLAVLAFRQREIR